MFRKMMLLATLMLCVGMVSAQMQPAAASAPAKITYPQTKTGDTVDDYFGTKVTDPYRWLEDENSPETKAWVEAENKVTFAYLDTIPERAAIKARLTELWNYERFGNPRKEGSHYFFARNSGLQNQSVWYQVDSLAGEPRMLLDPNTLSADGTVAVGGLAFTDDGSLLAYSVQDAGSDWQEWHVMNTQTGAKLPDVIKWAKFSGASWTKDGKGFFYSRYDEPKAETKMTGANYFQKLYYHQLGTPQSEDVLVYERPDNKEMGFGGFVTDDGAYLGITVWQGTDPKNRFYYKDLGQKDAPVVRLLDDFDARYAFVGNLGPVFYFQTDLQAPRGRVIAIDLRHPERKDWKTIVPESKDAMDNVSLLDKDKLVISYLHDARALVSIFSADGKHLKDLELPGIGTAAGFGGKTNDTETFYTYTSYTTPATVYRYDFTTGKSTLFRQPKVAFDPSQYETMQVFYTSKDGTRVP
ncbi:MAG TPA: S9 family peptidase, partial [Terriglobales bacterium]|nr:S9 family peptidase [Terriglobales bacterium]